MVGKINPLQRELKVDTLIKKSQGKSFFLTADNYKERVFVLGSEFLSYCGGSVLKREEEKARIKLSDVKAVEGVSCGESLNYKYGFQVAYEEDGIPFILYVFAANENQCTEWISAIRGEAVMNGADLSTNYHPAIWNKKTGFTCCGASSQSDDGCVPVSAHSLPEMRSRLESKTSKNGELLMDMMSKRAQGKSFFFGTLNYKERVFVLDSCCLRYFLGNLQKRGDEKCKILLSNILGVEEVKEGLLNMKKNAFQVIYEDSNEKCILYIVARSANMQQAWIQAIRKGAKMNCARLMSVYHPGIWIKSMGKYNCCYNIDNTDPGCQPVTLDLAAYTVSPQRSGSSREVKVGMLRKRSQNKSVFIAFKTYTKRVFVLTRTSLRYFTGTLQERGMEKGVIALSSIIIIAAVEDGALDGHRHVFQVSYIDNNNLFLLYMVAKKSQECQSWISAIAAEAWKAGAVLQDHYHKGVWTKHLGKFSCCGAIARDALGCVYNDPKQIMTSTSPSQIQHQGSSSSIFSSSSSSSSEKSA